MKKAKLISATLSLFIVPALFTSCELLRNDEEPGDPVPVVLDLKQKEVVTSANDFAFDLFKPVVSADQASKNIMLSPFSIISALSMTLNGAAGQTYDDMLTALRYDGLSLDEINGTYLKLMKEMVPVDPRVVMNIANSAWVEKRLAVKQAYIDALTTWYLAEVKSIDVTDPDAVSDVNSWIEEKTNGKISDMLNSLDPDLAMLLINAVYFNGKWRNRFDKSSTTDSPFYLPDNSSVSVPMMYQEGAFAVAHTENATLVELPYGQGNYSMVVLLPDEGKSLTDVAETLTPENWSSWMGYLSSVPSEIKLYMPRFRYEYKCLLNDLLTSLGMGIAFTDNADFSNISDQGLLISRVLHQTFIDNNEEGTEAAAATVVEISFTSIGTGPQVVNLNRPFIYVIRETTTGTIIFMGQVINPSQG